jgi:predicted component of type VI protein secretion system
MQSNFRMVMRAGPSVGKIYPLEKSEIFVGRDLSNDIVINDPEISRRHARLFMQGNSYVLEDLGSTNGTFVNGQRLMGPSILRPGDSITFGERMSLVFESADYDQDATVVSPALRPPYDNQGSAQVYSPQPSYQPDEPSYPPPASQPPVRQVDNYAGQVPSAYAPEMPAERRFSIIWIVVIVVLLLICLCLFIAIWNAPEEFWCLFPVWPEGYCP